jgi:hypothetical protein
MPEGTKQGQRTKSNRRTEGPKEQNAVEGLLGALMNHDAPCT